MNNDVSVDAFSSDSSKDYGVAIAGGKRYNNKNSISNFISSNILYSYNDQVEGLLHSLCCMCHNF